MQNTADSASVGGYGHGGPGGFVENLMIAQTLLLADAGQASKTIRLAVSQQLCAAALGSLSGSATKHNAEGAHLIARSARLPALTAIGRGILASSACVAAAENPNQTDTAGSIAGTATVSATVDGQTVLSSASVAMPPGAGHAPVIVPALSIVWLALVATVCVALCIRTLCLKRQQMKRVEPRERYCDIRRPRNDRPNRL